MKTDFVTCVSDHCTLLGKGLERMAWNEPSRLDIVLVEELEKPANAHSPRIEASRDITRRVFSSVGTKPSCDSINVNTDTTERP